MIDGNFVGWLWNISWISQRADKRDNLTSVFVKFGTRTRPIVNKQNAIHRVFGGIKSI